MGEAIYYLKAKFESSEAAKAAMERIAPFLEEGDEAQEWWQQHRNVDTGVFFIEFRDKFPAIHKYLLSFGFQGGSNNDLAGLLDFVRPEKAFTLEVQGSTFMYSAEVWHFADWDPFARFLESEFGAISAAWLSDEYISTDPFDLF